MTESRVTLESFEDGSFGEPKESAEYKRGFVAGTEAAQAGEEAKLTQATAGIASALSDMAFGYSEARVQLMERIRPLLAQVAETVLPHLAREGFAAHLVDVLSRDFEQALNGPVQISVHPDAVTHLGQSLAGVSDNFCFCGDDTLSVGQALLKNEDANVMIDLPALILALQTALNGHEPLERSQPHG